MLTADFSIRMEFCYTVLQLTTNTEQRVCKVFKKKKKKTRNIMFSRSINEFILILIFDK